METSSSQPAINFLPKGILQKHKNVSSQVFLDLNDAMEQLCTKDNRDSDGDNKVAYMKALSLAPDLILEESDPLKFLRFHDFAASKAANRLIEYWHRRCDIFGSEDAFKPMTLQNGALNQDDREYLTSGHYARAPDNDLGHHVVIIDPSRRVSDAIRTRLRAIFYFYQIADKEAVLIAIWKNPKLDLGTPQVHSLLKCFATRIKTVHFVDVMQGQNFFYQNFVNGIRAIYGELFRAFGVDIRMHNPKAREQTCTDLQKFDLRRHHIPEIAGGDYIYTFWHDFLEKQKETELQQYANFPGFSSLVAGPETPFLSRSSNSIDATSIQHLEGAFASFSVDDVEIYNKAKGNVRGDCWLNECPAAAFLRREDGDSVQAARRMIRYWEIRGSTFKNRQYDLLTQTGEDALRRRELSVLKTGFCCPLPKDSHGRPALWIDPSALPEETTLESRDRCLFYVLSVLAEDEVAQTTGIVLLSKEFDSSMYAFLRGINDALPIRFHSIHTIPSDPLFGHGVDVEVSMLGAKCYTYSGWTITDIAIDLQLNHGLPKSRLPSILGGDWSYAKFLRWQELRTRTEWGLSLGGARKEAGLALFPAMRETLHLPYDQKVERKRRMDVLHFRRKRDRALLEGKLLEDRVDQLREDNESLKQQHSTLQLLYEEAVQIVESSTVERVSFVETIDSIGKNTLPLLAAEPDEPHNTGFFFELSGQPACLWKGDAGDEL